MAQNVKRIDEFPGAGLWDKRTSSRLSREELFERLPFEGAGARQTILDQGVRLSGAFMKISNGALREAIVNLVVEMEKIESARQPFTADHARLAGQLEAERTASEQ